MNRKTEALIFNILAAIFGIYILLRAWLLPITVDECATVLNHVSRLVFDTLTYEKEANPNNHILNTIAIKTLTGIFGWHPVVVRLPVLIGGFFYGWAALMLSRRLSEQSWVRLFAFVALLGNPYLLEFFSLARGYGFAAGLMLMAIWQAWRFLEENQVKHLRAATIFAGLATYANFTLLIFFAPFIALLLVVSWQLNPSWSIFWKKMKPALITVGIFIALWSAPLIRLSKDPEILNWNELGSLVGSMQQSVKAAIQNNGYLGGNTVQILTWLAILFSVGIWVVAAWRWWRQGRKFASDPRLLLIILLPSVLIANVLQVYLTKTPYLQSRLALFYYPLFALQLGVAAAWLWQRWERRAWAFMAPILLLIIINLARCVNLRKSSEWWFDQGTYVVLDFFKKAYQNEGKNAPYTLDAHHVMLNSFAFHLERDPRGFHRYLKLSPFHGPRPPQRDTEFYYAINREEVREVQDAYEVVLEVPNTSFVLLKKK